MTARKRVVEATRKKSAPTVQEIRVRVMHDEDPDTSFFDSGDPEYKDQDEDRREQYERGDFSFVGVRAETDVDIQGVLQTLTSGGLWGVESDGKVYIEEVAAEEYNDLRKILISIGVSTAQLPTKFDPKWIKWEA